MKYRDFNEWEFAEDQYFVDWVLHPNKHSSKFWKSFLENNPEKSKEVLLAREIISNIQYKHTPKMTNEEYVSLFERILVSNRALRPTSSYKKNYQWLKYAAVILLALSASLILFQQNGSKNDTSSEKTVVMLTKECPEGSQLTTMLSDGSKVKLNAGSKISYPKVFSDTLRLVTLTGEAYFEVTSDPSRPFMVTNNLINVQVLGTSFNIRAYKNEEKVSVAVAKGKVNVTSSSYSIVQFDHTLLPFQESELNVKTNQVIKRELFDDKVFAWTNWKLIFEKESLAQIFKRLERWYGVNFELKDHITISETYSGSFDNDPLKVVLEALKSQGAFDYEIIDKRILITQKQNNPKYEES